MLGRTIAVALVLAPLAAAPTVAQTGKPADARPDAANPIIVYTRDAARAAPTAALIARAREKGTIRVIVGLDLTMRDENTLTPAQEAAQSQALTSVQTEVLNRALPGIAASRVVRFETIPFLSVWVNAEQLARLLAEARVVSLQEDVPVPPSLADSVPLIEANRVWAKGFRGETTVIAVLDTGSDGNNNMLSGAFVEEACYSTNSGADITSVCPGGLSQKVGPGAGKPCPLNVTSCEHGTHVASIAAGFASSVRGVAFKSGLIVVQVFTRFALAADCNPSPAPCARSFSTDQVKGLERLYRWRNDHRIAAANMSLGGGKHFSVCDGANPALTAVILKLRRAGIATAIASGNDGYDGTVNSPACISHAIAVGNGTKNDRVADRSNHGPLVKLMAPGTNIRAARAGTTTGLLTLSGTSMAAPHVAGAFSLLRDSKPNATVDEILAALQCTGLPVKRPSGYDLTKPRIQSLDAWPYLQNPPNRARRWDFTNLSDADDWKVLSGRWGIDRNHWVLSRFRTDGVWNLSWHPNCNDSLAVEAYMQRIDTTSIETGHAGLLLKGSVDPQSGRVSGYFFAFYPRLGYASAFRLDHYKMKGIPAGSFGGGCGHKHVTINENGFNRLKVVSRRGTHSFFVNGDLVCTFFDATYHAGAVGLIGGRPDPWDGRRQTFRVKWIKIAPLTEGSSAPGVAALPR
jgi:subtilisin family serine protease